MTSSEVGRLWWAAMENGQKKDGEMFVFFTSRHLLRKIRRSGGRLPKPPGLEEMQIESASVLGRQPCCCNRRLT